MFAWLLSAAKYVGGHAALHALLFNKGKLEEGFKKEIIQAIAPRFSKKLEDEAVVEGVVQRKFNPTERVVLGNFRGRLGPNQRDHLSVALAQTHDSSQKLDNTGDDVVAGFLRDLINTDPPPAAYPDRAAKENARHAARVNKCAERGFMLRDEEHYLIGLLQGFAGRRFDSLQELYDWLMATPPDAEAPRWEQYRDQIWAFVVANWPDITDGADDWVGQRLAAQPVAGVDAAGNITYTPVPGSVSHARDFRQQAAWRRQQATARRASFRWWNPRTW